MNTSEAGQFFIKQFESLQLDCYDDGGGFATVGWGHKIKEGEEILQQGITIDQAEQLFLSDLEDAEQIVNNSFRIALNQNQFDSLVSFAFNTGKMSATLKTLIRLQATEDDIKLWWQTHYITSNGIQLNGLKRRRKAESENYFKIQNAII